MTNSSFKKMMITKQSLKNDFEKMGICNGDHVAVTLSLKSIGFVEGGPEAFIEALLEAVGSEGTVMMNTFTKSFPIYAIDDEFVFNSKSTPCWTGLVPETFRKRKSAIRSNHPCSSVSAIGKKATYLTKDHIDDSHFAPYSRLASINGKYLAIGLGNKLVAIRHQAQQQAGLAQIVRRPFAVKYINPNGKQRLFVCNRAPCVTRIGELTPYMKKAGIIKQGKIGNAQSLVVYAKEFLDFLSDLLKKDPTLNLCKSRYCLWCREVERKLGLYKKIKLPKYFQKYRIIQVLFALRNRFDLTKFDYLSYRRKFNPKLVIPVLGIETDNIVEDACWVLVDFLNLRPKFCFQPRRKEAVKTA